MKKKIALISGGETFQEASSGIWEWLGEEGLFRKILKYGLLLSLAAGTGLSFKGAYDAHQVEKTTLPLPPTPPTIDVPSEQRRLTDMSKTFSSAMSVRRNSTQYVALLEAANRQPYKPMERPMDEALTGEEGVIPSRYPTEIIAAPPEIIPPIMSIRSIFIFGNKRAAVMDIESDGDGVVVLEGQKFGQGEGKVVKIVDKKVVVVWSGKKIELSIDQ